MSPKMSAALLCCVVVACAGNQKKAESKSDNGQSFEQAMTLVCHVDDHVASTDDPIEQDQRRADFLQAKVKNPDAIYHRTLWGIQSNVERAKRIRELSLEACLKACPYADLLENESF